MGWASEALNPVSDEFVEFCHSQDGAVLDIGAAFGVASLAALRAGVSVIANDIDVSHLAELQLRAQRSCTTEEYTRLAVRLGRFPQNLFFPEESLAAVHASSVFHFLTGNRIEQGLKSIRRWLRPGGKFFLQAATPYQEPFAAFVPEYERRVALGERWPGWIEQTRAYSEHRLLSQMPRSIHLLDDKVLSRAASEAGLDVERAWLYRRPELSPTIFLDGRESVGLIAKRP
jgi:SAM-dependent methyltransferase